MYKNASIAINYVYIPISYYSYTYSLLEIYNSKNRGKNFYKNNFKLYNLIHLIKYYGV